MRSIIIAASLLLSLAFALPVAAGDAANGRTIFDTRCAKCHSFDPSASGKRGPHLAGLFDRRYGAVEGFPYRMVWTAANPLWTREHLNDYLEIHGVFEAEDRDNLVEYLVEATRK